MLLAAIGSPVGGFDGKIGCWRCWDMHQPTNRRGEPVGEAYMKDRTVDGPLFIIKIFSQDHPADT